MHEQLYYCDATDLATLVRSKQVSPIEIMRAHLERIQWLNPRLNAVVTLNESAEGRPERIPPSAPRDSGTSAVSLPESIVAPRRYADCVLNPAVIGPSVFAISWRRCSGARWA